MNRTCNGTHFTAFGTNWYRCLMSGSILQILPKEDELCPSCERPMKPDSIPYSAKNERVEIEIRKMCSVPDIGTVLITEKVCL